jgi:hypothetical protein
MKTENETEKHTKTETPSNEFYARLCGSKNYISGYIFKLPYFKKSGVR